MTLLRVVTGVLLLGLAVAKLVGGSVASLPGLTIAAMVVEFGVGMALLLNVAPRLMACATLALGAAFCVTSWVDATALAATDCGCLGKKIQLSLRDHVLLSTAVLGLGGCLMATLPSKESQSQLSSAK